MAEQNSPSVAAWHRDHLVCGAFISSQ